MTLGEKIQHLRTQRRLTQTELAKKAGVDQAIISRLENKLSFNVRSDVLKALAKALGCTTDYLVGMHEDEETESCPTMAALA
jgi:transcriptional regulator with XRE-family HTH domain